MQKAFMYKLREFEALSSNPIRVQWRKAVFLKKTLKLNFPIFSKSVSTIHVSQRVNGHHLKLRKCKFTWHDT
jgi:hypothetical protein